MLQILVIFQGFQIQVFCPRASKSIQVLKVKNGYLIDIEVSYESVEYPRESCLQRVDPQLVQVIANLRLKHLKQIFKQLT